MHQTEDSSPCFDGRQTYWLRCCKKKEQLVSVLPGGGTREQELGSLLPLGHLKTHMEFGNPSVDALVGSTDSIRSLSFKTSQT